MMWVHVGESRDQCLRIRARIRFHRYRQIVHARGAPRHPDTQLLAHIQADQMVANDHDHARALDTDTPELDQLRSRRTDIATITTERARAQLLDDLGVRSGAIANVRFHLRDLTGAKHNDPALEAPIASRMVVTRQRDLCRSRLKPRRHHAREASVLSVSAEQ